MNYTQENRKIAIETSLASDTLLLAGFSGTESISAPFEFDLEMLSTDDSLDLTPLIGTNATFRITLADGTQRYFNGYFNRISQGVREDRFASYSAHFVPWLWFLTQNVRSRIFQNKKVPDIIQQIFSEYGFQDYSLRLYGTFLDREYCVQYRESDFAFISRLLEQEGIFYFFNHENGKHTLILANSSSAHEPCPGGAEISHQRGSGGVREEDVISDWNMHRHLRPGKFTLSDYNFETPSTSLRVDVSSAPNFEVYDYPGLYGKRGDGDQLARIRLQESDMQLREHSGASDCRVFAAGFRFQLMDHYRSDQNGWYTLVQITHSAHQGGNYFSSSASDGDEEFHYTNAFYCIPFETQFRPRCLTRKPFVQGSQTAVVAGPAGEEIFTDKYGRIKVQFHWDREGQNDENSSCWMRVSHMIAGKQWGSISLPRVGQEVIVDFLEGDPDRPIVTGTVYNAEQMPPYSLPVQRTKSTFKSRSSPGGDGFNEFRFEDQKGKEQVFLHAQRDLHMRIRNDTFVSTVGEQHIKASKTHFEEVGGDHNLTVKGDCKEKVDGTVSCNAGADMQVKVGNNYAMESGTEIHLKAGMNLVIEAGTSLTLKVGGNFINISPMGVAISGSMVLINTGGAAGSGSPASPDAPQLPKEADQAQSGDAAKPPRQPPVKPAAYSTAAVVMKQAAATGTPFCEICQNS